MKKSRLYRVGSALLAAAMVFTCMPQTGLYVLAEEVPADAYDSDVDNNQDDAEQLQVDQDNADGSGKSQESNEDLDVDDETGQNKEGDEPAEGEIPEPEPAEGEVTKPEPAEGVISEPEPAIAVPLDDSAPTEKQDLKISFESLQIKDKTYDREKHSVGGRLSLSVPARCTITYQVTGTLSGTIADDAFNNPDGLKYERKITETDGQLIDITGDYENVAPVNVGNYTLKISVEADKDIYNYENGSFQRSFAITRRQPNEMKFTGITGIKDKIYDGMAVDFSSQIRNAKVLTGSDVDITDKVAPLEFYIKKKLSDGKYDEGVKVDTTDVSASMPAEVGEYALCVKLVENETNNYKAKEQNYPFAIKTLALAITVKDQEMHVSDDGSLTAGEPLTEDRFGELYQIKGLEGLPEDERDAFKEALKIVPLEDVDSGKTGIYDLVVSGIDEKDWPNYEITLTNAKLTVKGLLHTVKSELKAVTNILNGMSLGEIANKLPKTTTIYLYNGGKKPADSGNTGDAVEPDIPVTAEIMWDTTRVAEGSYNVGTKTAQTFKMQGTVILPELVYTDDDSLLTVVVSVSVREATTDQALRPYTDTPAGTVGVGTRVRLFTEEAGAQIWYTVDASEPATSSSSRLYNNDYIEIKNTMTIKAISRVVGKRDSEVLRLVYYYDKNLNPGGSDDPDEPDVPDEDVPKDENGNKLPIPDDLWVTDVAKYIYTGKAIKPEVRVYDHKKRLEEKKDYTVSYKNNTNAADKDHPTKAPTITITGKGNYEGKLLKTFTIEPKNINDTDVKADDLTVAFNNKAQKPAPTVTWNGKKLAGKKDYVFDATPQTAAGSYQITLTGTGNYTGDRKISFTITNGVPVSKLTVSKIPAQTYTGEAFMPKPTVKNGKELLVEGKDYTLSYEDNTEVGTAAVIIKGAANSRFAGMKRVTFSIKEAALMNKAKIALQFKSGMMYTGNEITASDYNVTVSLKVDGVTQTRTLVKDKDYKVTYQNNVKVGTATAVFEGINAYRGTQKKTFKITAYNLMLDPNKKLSIQAAESYPYMKGGSTQKPVIKFDGKTLTEGTDYTLSYKNHTAAGNYATMTIKGKGNFAGSTMKGYLVETQNLAKMTVTPADKVYQPKANIYKTTVRVYDTNGKLLSAGKDYDKNVIYTYSLIPGNPKIITADNSVRKVGDVVAATDIIPYGTKIRVTVKAAGSNYQGTAEGVYSITRADIAKAKVTVPQQTYTGKPIELKESDISVLMNGMVVAPEEYKIIGYTNNVNKGTAKLTIQGQGNYGGTKTVTFKIKGKSLLKLFG